jgi:DNA-binding MarR family transcriptional regulator
MHPHRKLIAEIVHAAHRLTTARNAMLAAVGLTGARVRLLKKVNQLPIPFTVAQLARVMDVSRQAVRPIVHELETAGLIRLQMNPRHKRAPVVILTSLGRARLDEVRRLEQRWISDITRGFPDRLTAQTAWVVAVVRERASD